MAIKIPKEIELLGRVYTITTTNDGNSLGLDGKFMGLTSFDRGEIILYTGESVCDAQLFSTFLHEIKHILNKQMKLVNPDDALEETDCERFALFYTLVHKALNGETRRKIDVPDKLIQET